MPKAKVVTQEEKQETELEFLYNRYAVTLNFITPIASGVPATQGLATRHAKLFSASVTNDMKASKKDLGEVSEEAVHQYLLSCSSVFYLDDDKGVYIRGYQFNAMLKDAAQRTKVTLKIRGLNNTIRDGGLLFPDRIYMNTEPTVVERPSIPEGKSANIKIFQTAEIKQLVLPCAVLDNGDLTDSLFKQLWVVAQGVGIGSNRHLGYGRFEVANIEEAGGWNITDLFRQNGPIQEAVSPVPGELVAAD